MYVEFRNITIGVDIPDDAKPELAYEILCNALGTADNLEWETDTFVVGEEKDAVEQGTYVLYAKDLE